MTDTVKYKNNPKRIITDLKSSSIYLHKHDPLSLYDELWR